MSGREGAKYYDSKGASPVIGSYVSLFTDKLQSLAGKLASENNRNEIDPEDIKNALEKIVQPRTFEDMVRTYEATSSAKD